MINSKDILIFSPGVTIVLFLEYLKQTFNGSEGYNASEIFYLKR